MTKRDATILGVIAAATIAAAVMTVLALLIGDFR